MKVRIARESISLVIISRRLEAMVFLFILIRIHNTTESAWAACNEAFILVILTEKYHVLRVFFPSSIRFYELFLNLYIICQSYIIWKFIGKAIKHCKIVLECFVSNAVRAIKFISLFYIFVGFYGLWIFIAFMLWVFFEPIHRLWDFIMGLRPTYRIEK